VRLLYLGLPLGALGLTARGHRPDVVGTWHLDAPGHRRLRRALAPRGTLLLGRPDLADPATLAMLASVRPDALVSWFWPRRIPPAVLDLPRLGAYGVHPSLLPRWRGPDPTFHAIRAGDRASGVTLHRLDPSYDTGLIVAQRRVAIDPRWTGWDLARALDRPGLALLFEAADRLATTGEALPGMPQDEAQATEAPIPSDEELAIDWTRPAADVLRLIRTAAPDPGATARLGDQVVAVLAAHPHAGPSPRGLRPAESFRDDADHLVVMTGDHQGVAIDTIRLLTGPPTGLLLSGSEIAGLVDE